MGTSAYIDEINITVTDENTQKAILEIWENEDHDYSCTLFFDQNRLECNINDISVPYSFWDETVGFFTEHVFPYAQVGDYFTLTDTDGEQYSSTYRKETDGSVTEHETVKIRPSFDSAKEIVELLASCGADLQEILREIDSRLNN